jgi:hypothetical protein
MNAVYTNASTKIKFDVLAGSSIGAVNASIICAAQNAGKDVPKLLEDFWLSLADSSIQVFLAIQRLFCLNGLCLIPLTISCHINGLIFMMLRP